MRSCTIRTNCTHQNINNHTCFNEFPRRYESGKFVFQSLQSYDFLWKHKQLFSCATKCCVVGFLLFLPFPKCSAELQTVSIITKSTGHATTGMSSSATSKISANYETNQIKGSKWPWPAVCLGIEDLFIALFLILLILMTVLGNILVVLSVFLYKRMRTFTNFLLTSLATADLLVGLLIMPLSLIDLLHDHRWPFGRFLCQIWATSDVLLCTASILNLCIISLDRYMAITSPLKYPRTRSRPMACGLLCLVWGISMIVVAPPWFIPEWNLFFNQPADESTYVCAYSPSVPYRIYSALVMLSVYFKIFRVASERERLMRQSLGTCRLSRRVEKTQRKGYKNNSYSNSANNNRCSSMMLTNVRHVQAQYGSHNYCTNNTYNNYNSEKQKKISHSLIQNRPPLMRSETGASDVDESGGSFPSSETVSPNRRPNENAVEELRFINSTQDLWSKSSQKSQTQQNRCSSTNSQQQPCWNATNSLILRSTQQNTNNNHLPNPTNLLAKAQQHYHTNGPGKALRGSKEKIVYLRERKALKTIGIIVLGFIICWMPFFVVYLVEVFLNNLTASYSFKLLNEFFLWLGYSNSVMNPLIYTMYNGDFRRCFRDLLGFGCMQQHRRTMSVKKLHQQSTLF